MTADEMLIDNCCDVTAMWTPEGLSVEWNGKAVEAREVVIIVTERGTAELHIRSLNGSPLWQSYTDVLIGKLDQVALRCIGSRPEE